MRAKEYELGESYNDYSQTEFKAYKLHVYVIKVLISFKSGQFLTEISLFCKTGLNRYVCSKRIKQANTIINELHKLNITGHD